MNFEKIKISVKTFGFVAFCTSLWAQNTGDELAQIDKKDKVLPQKKVETAAKSTQILLLTNKATIQNASILNGDKDDFSPMFYENGILYCSNSRKAKKDAENVPDDYNLKYAAFDSLGKLQKPTSFAKRANTKTHEGPSCFTRNMDTMFLTRNMSKGGVDKANKNGKYTVKIYLKVKDTTGNFVGEKTLPFELESYNYCHPTLAADGKRLFFASDMPGGFGGMDIYFIRKINDSTWTPPINLGARVNTAGNEIFPHLTGEKKLFFASNGRKKEKTDLDLFVLDVDNRIAKSETLPAPFNTDGDDFGLMILPQNPTRGYFSSNRTGGSGGDDIYEFELEKE